MPEGAIYVGRPGRWGNPFKIGNTFRFETLNGTFIGVIRTNANAVVAFNEYVRYRDDENGRALRDMICDDLAARDLACWCPLDQPCHADVLLEIANGTQP